MSWLLGAVLTMSPAYADDHEPADLLKALELPTVAQSLRDKGVSEDDVRGAIEAARDSKVHADAAAETLQAAETAVDEHGPVDNFGAFVNAKLEEGLRGKDLADAIKAEHQANGKGKGHGKDKDKDKDNGNGGGNGKSDDAGERGSSERGESDERGSSQRGEAGERGSSERGESAGARGGKQGEKAPTGERGSASRGGPGDGAKGGPSRGGKKDKDDDGGMTRGGK